MNFTTKNGVSRKGTSKPIMNKALFDRVRKKLNRKKKDLPDKFIRDTLNFALKDIATWLIENPEGFRIENMGVLATSKHLPKEFWDDKEQKIKKIESLDIPEHLRKTFLSRYNINLGDKLNYATLKEIKKALPRLNTHTFFYVFKVMWFNHRNCNFLKSMCYEFDFTREGKKRLKDKIVDGMDYYEWNFDDFYGYKISPLEKSSKNKWAEKLKKEQNE